jgi:hypothetical protein
VLWGVVPFEALDQPPGFGGRDRRPRRQAVLSKRGNSAKIYLLPRYNFAIFCGMETFHFFALLGTYFG